MRRANLFALGAAALLSACGSPLNGSWIRCASISQTSSTQATLTIDGTRLAITYKSYGNLLCAGTGTSVDEAATVGTLRIGDSSTVVSGAKNLDLTLTSIATPDVTTTSYTIYKIDGRNLYFGVQTDSNDGTDSTLRHRSLDSTPYLRQ